VSGTATHARSPVSIACRRGPLLSGLCQNLCVAGCSGCRRVFITSCWPALQSTELPSSAHAAAACVCPRCVHFQPSVHPPALLCARFKLLVRAETLIACVGLRVPGLAEGLGRGWVCGVTSLGTDAREQAAFSPLCTAREPPPHLPVAILSSSTCVVAAPVCLAVFSTSPLAIPVNISCPGAGLPGLVVCWELFVSRVAAACLSKGGASRWPTTHDGPESESMFERAQRLQAGGEPPTRVA
jgi:hypothetical protein